MPTGYFPTTWKVAGSITQTSPDLLCGTYTSGLSPLTAAASIPAPAAASTLCGSVTAGMPGSSFLSTGAGGFGWLGSPLVGMPGMFAMSSLFEVEHPARKSAKAASTHRKRITSKAPRR